MTELTPERLDELDALANAATKGPWEWSMYATTPYSLQWSIQPGVLIADGLDGTPDGDEIDRANAAFIAASREAVPALTAEVRRLRGELAEAKRQAIEDMAHWAEVEGVMVIEDDCGMAVRGSLANWLRERI